jgi:hypothetical protein
MEQNKRWWGTTNNSKNVGIEIKKIWMEQHLGNKEHKIMIVGTL